MLGRAGRGRYGRVTGTMGAGLQLPRHREHHVPRHEDDGGPERAFAARVYPRDWLLPYAGAGGRADIGAARWMRGQAVPGKHEARVVRGASLKKKGNGKEMENRRADMKLTKKRKAELESIIRAGTTTNYGFKRNQRSLP